MDLRRLFLNDSNADELYGALPPLLLAVAHGCSYRVVHALIGARADPNYRSAAAAHRTPLTIACECPLPDPSRAAELVAALLGWKADPNLACAHGPPLHVAIASAACESAELLVRARACMSQRGPKGEDALLLAVRCAHASIAAMLIAAGAPLHQADADGRAPLHAAVVAGMTEVVALLIHARADARRADAAGETPLHAAVELGSLASVRLLIEYGHADADAARSVRARWPTGSGLGAAWVVVLFDVCSVLRGRSSDECSALMLAATNGDLLLVCGARCAV
jgi:ankyrin repeat protein